MARVVVEHLREIVPVGAKYHLALRDVLTNPSHRGFVMVWLRIPGYLFSGLMQVEVQDDYEHCNENDCKSPHQAATPEDVRAEA